MGHFAFFVTDVAVEVLDEQLLTEAPVTKHCGLGNFDALVETHLAG